MRFIFVALYRYFEKHPKWYWGCFVLIFAFCIFFASKIKFEQDINKMVPHDASIEAMNAVLNKTKTGEKIIFSMSFHDSLIKNPDSLIVLQQDFEQQLKIKGKNGVKLIETQIDQEKEQEFIDVAIDYLPLFLTEEDYASLDSLIQPEQIESNLEKSHKLLLSPAGVVASQWLSHDPIGMMRFAFEKLKMLNVNSDYDLYDGYIFNRDNRQLNFFLTSNYAASETGKNKPLFETIDELIQKWSVENPEVKIAYFGGPAVAAANATQMQKDTLFTLSLTVVLLLILIWYVFRKKRAPVLLLLPVLFGGLMGLAITYLIQGSISIIAIGSGAVILGIAIDFSVHFMSHARTHQNMEENVRSLVAPLTLGAFTTIGAFFALQFTNAPVLQDLGLFAGSSLLGASLFTLIFLPHLFKENKKANQVPFKENVIDKIAKLNPDRNKYLIVLVLLVTPIMFYFSGKVQFDADLMNLNYMSPELKEAQEELNKDNAFALSSVFIVAKDSTEDGASERMAKVNGLLNRFLQTGGIRKMVNPLSILPAKSEQENRIERWNSFWNEDKKKSVTESVNKLAWANGFSAAAFEDFEQTLNKTYSGFDETTSSFLMSLMPDAFSSKGGAHLLITTLKVRQSDRAELLNAFSNQDQVIATDRQSVTASLLDLLTEDFNQVFLISGLLVFFALLIAYGRIELALISFLPLAITWVWILGIMAILGLKFNIVNIIISTLIFGLGDDYSIFMMDGLMEKYKTGKNRIAQTRSAVYLSVITTIIGLGTLIFAEHPALKSIAAISIVGLLSVVLISQIVQPFLFNILIQNRADKGFMPLTLSSIFKSLFSFLYFFVGSILLTIFGFLLFAIKPFGKAKSKYLFHYFLSKYAKSVFYMMLSVKKTIRIPNPQVFNQPAIYIANHSSFLDILATIMLHPKLILLTNRWVWNSPVFGKIVRMAEYYPVTEGAEQGLDHLKGMVAQGYGIVIFPEGTRSKSGKIGRFKKGAFYLSEKLNLDIVPLFLHGLGNTIQKNDWLLKDGIINIIMDEPIKNMDKNFGLSYSERAKPIGQWFRKKHQQQKEQIQTPQYFKKQLLKSYIYKGPVLEWYCRIKSKMEDYYEPFHVLLPQSGLFYDLGCGYGFMTFMLHWAAPQRKIIGVDYDEEKILTAQNNYTQKNQFELKEDKVEFITADLTQITLSKCEGILLSDALHYLLPEQQIELLNKCYEALNEEGVLILRDGATELEDRHNTTKRTELFSTRIFRFNKTNNELHFVSQKLLKEWAIERQLDLQIIDPKKNTSNLIFVFKKTKN